MADSKNIDDGGPAYPCEGGVDSGLYAAPGMSLRDYFAGQALAGIYACRDLQLATLHDQAKTGAGDFDACMAKQAYAQADAMIAAGLMNRGDVLPEVVEALKELLEAYSKPDERLCCDGRECGCMGSTVHQMAEHYARAAIARAEGRS